MRHTAHAYRLLSQRHSASTSKGFAPGRTKTTAELRDGIIALGRQVGGTTVIIPHLVERMVSPASKVMLMKAVTIGTRYRTKLPHPHRDREDLHRGSHSVRQKCCAHL